MHKNSTALKTLTLAATVALFSFLGTLFLHSAFSFTLPTLAPPNGNTPLPLNSSNTYQKKPAPLGATSFYDTDSPDYFLNPSNLSKLKGLWLGKDATDLHRIKNVKDPQDPQDAATKGYVDLKAATLTGVLPANQLFFPDADIQEPRPVIHNGHVWYVGNISRSLSGTGVYSYKYSKSTVEFLPQGLWVNRASLNYAGSSTVPAPAATANSGVLGAFDLNGTLYAITMAETNRTFNGPLYIYYALQIHRFDDVTNTWSTDYSISSRTMNGKLEYGINGVQTAAAQNNKIYFIGYGVVADYVGPVVRRIYEFDPVTKQLQFNDMNGALTGQLDVSISNSPIGLTLLHSNRSDIYKYNFLGKSATLHAQLPFLVFGGLEGIKLIQYQGQYLYIDTSTDPAIAKIKKYDISANTLIDTGVSFEAAQATTGGIRMIALGDELYGLGFGQGPGTGKWWKMRLQF